MCTAKHTSVWCIVCNNPGSSSIVLKSEIESGPKRPLDPSSASNTMKADHTDLYSYLETLPSLPIFKPSVHNTSFCLKAVSECQALDPKPPGGAVSTTSYVLCSTHRRAGEHRLSLREEKKKMYKNWQILPKNIDQWSRKLITKSILGHCVNQWHLQNLTKPIQNKKVQRDMLSGTWAKLL